MAGIRNLEELPVRLQKYYEFSERYNHKKRSGFYRQVLPIPFEIAMRYFSDSPGKKSLVCGNCIVCQDYFEMPWARIARRKHCANVQVCKKCALKYATNTSNWRENNSKAQLIAQNRPDVKMRMAESVRRSKTPEVLKKQSDSSKKMWRNPIYREYRNLRLRESFENLSEESRERMSCSNGFYTGRYLSKFGPIYFNSSWELAYVIWCEKNESVLNLKRCSYFINYKFNGKDRKYNPDFIIRTTSGKYVIEIKGARKNRRDNVFQYKMAEVEAKCKAAEKRYNGKCPYCLYFYEDLINMGVLKRTYRAKDFCNSVMDKIENFKHGLNNGKSINDNDKEQDDK